MLALCLNDLIILVLWMKATSSIDILGGYNDQWNSVSSTEKWTFGENSWQDLLYVVEEAADQRNYFSFTICMVMKVMNVQEH